MGSAHYAYNDELKINMGKFSILSSPFIQMLTLLRWFLSRCTRIVSVYLQASPFVGSHSPTPSGSYTFPTIFNSTTSDLAALRLRTGNLGETRRDSKSLLRSSFPVIISMRSHGQFFFSFALLINRSCDFCKPGNDWPEVGLFKISIQAAIRRTLYSC
jgi:hypothetical protein